MQIRFLLIPLAFATLASCHTAYKSGQTPDDLYYSPVKINTSEQDQQDKEDDRVSSSDPDETRIRMGTRDRRWRDMDRDYGCDCTYDPYHYGYNNGYYYNPYYYRGPVCVYGTPVINPKLAAARTTNLGSYTRVATPVVDPKTGAVKGTSIRPYNNSNSRSNRREILTSTESSSNSRTYSPSTSTSTSTKNSSSGQSMSRPARKN